MLKFLGRDKAGNQLVGFGLSEENIRRLKLDQPIVVNMAEMGKPEWGTVLICYGKTEKDLAKIIEESGAHA